MPKALKAITPKTTEQVTLNKAIEWIALDFEPLEDCYDKAYRNREEIYKEHEAVLNEASLSLFTAMSLNEISIYTQMLDKGGEILCFVSLSL